MRTLRMVAVLALTVAGLLSLPVFADEVKPPAAPPETAAPATPPPTAAPAPPAKPAAPTTGPLQIKVGEATLRFGVLFQPQADFQQNTAGAYSQNLLVRRARFLIGGQVAKTVFIFFETENSRLGAAKTAGTKPLNTGFQTLDY